MYMVYKLYNFNLTHNFCVCYPTIKPVFFKVTKLAPMPEQQPDDSEP